MKRLGILICSLVMIIGCAFNAMAGDTEIVQANVPTGRTGGMVNISFKLETGDSWDENKETILYIDCGDAYEDIDLEDKDIAFPFEVSDELRRTGYEKNLGKIRKNASKSVSFSMKVRRDIPEKYYSFRAEVKQDSVDVASTNLRIWVKKSTTNEKDDNASSKHVSFEIGEGQPTPTGKYPSIMNFSLNLRNSGMMGANDVKASLVCDANSEAFPFDINEANYDRYFEYISPGETVELPYSFAIREKAYTGYYPIKINVTYREGTEGELQKEEKNFFVHIFNKDKESEQREFNANDRTKSRIIVDSFRTVPETIYAGDEFDLYVTFKNASTNVDASNLLLTFDSEKVSESPVFVANNGSNSIVLNSLKADETQEVLMHFSAAAGIDQRIYTMNISQKYDSPEFKNAEEKVSVSLPVHQIAKFNMGTVEVMPDSLVVGDECNVMFPINNTGKVVLYNTMVRFESETIETTESYIGNIKPGETGNVDVMLRAMAPSTDTGKVNVIISYEDEYGTVTENTKEILIYVNEAMDDYIEEPFAQEIVPEEKKIYEKPLFWIIIGVVAAGAGLIVAKKIKKKKEKEDLAKQA